MGNVKSVEVESLSKEEGLKKGSELLGVDISKVKIEIISEGKKSFFGKPKPYKFKIYYEEEEKVKEVKEEIKEEIAEIEEIEGEHGIFYFELDGLYFRFFQNKKVYQKQTLFIFLKRLIVTGSHI